MMPSRVVGKPIREVIDLLGWVGLDTTYKVLRDRLAEHLREVKHVASNRQAGDDGKRAVLLSMRKTKEGKLLKSYHDCPKPKLMMSAERPIVLIKFTLYTSGRVHEVD